MNCKYCGSENTIKKGGENRSSGYYKAYKCKDCGRRTFVCESATKIPISMALTEKDIRTKHDAAFKIRKAAEELKGDVFYTEFDFLKLCELPSGGYRYLIDSGQFDMYRGRAGNITYWSHPDNIKRLKAEGILR